MRQNEHAVAELLAHRARPNLQVVPSRQGALVPVTAKLSRSFYDKLGDDVAGARVDWFNAVDSDYKNDLKEMNDLNWE